MLHSCYARGIVQGQRELSRAAGGGGNRLGHVGTQALEMAGNPASMQWDSNDDMSADGSSGVPMCPLSADGSSGVPMCPLSADGSSGVPMCPLPPRSFRSHHLGKTWETKGAVTGNRHAQGTRHLLTIVCTFDVCCRGIG
jgi:hypothetical protein